jgi:hypothetical protein
VLDELASSSTGMLTIDNRASLNGDPLTALRDMLGAVCRHWEENGETVRELRSLVAVTGTEPPVDAVQPDYLKAVVAGLDAGGHLRARWSSDEAVDALALLTSYPTFERLRGAPTRSAEEIESLLAMLAVSIVAPNGSTDGVAQSAGAKST